MKRQELIHKQYDYQESEDYYDMACEWINQNNFEKAETCLKHALGMNKNFIYAYITLSEVYEKQKKYQEAVHILREAFKIDTTFDELPYRIAKSCLLARDIKNAMKFIQKAIDLNPSQKHLEFQEMLNLEYGV